MPGDVSARAEERLTPRGLGSPQFGDSVEQTRKTCGPMSAAAEELNHPRLLRSQPRPRCDWTYRSHSAGSARQSSVNPRAGGVALIAKETIAAEATESISCGL